MTAMSTPGAQPFYHGTKADLKEGDLIGPGFASNYGKRKKAACSQWAPAWPYTPRLAAARARRRRQTQRPIPTPRPATTANKKFPGNRRSHTVPVRRR
jgi:rifampin ADP-ribosylating transferase